MAPAASAFVVVNQRQQTSTIRSTASRLEMTNTENGHRRQVLQQSAALLLSTLVAASTPAFAERPTYLTEPTEDFKESERQRAEFRKQQAVVKQKFAAVLDHMTNESKTEGEIEQDLKDLRSLVTMTGGLPLGIKKTDLVKIVRAKKAKGFWPTSVEYAYVVICAIVLMCLCIMTHIAIILCATGIKDSLARLTISKAPTRRKTLAIRCKNM